jgi:hypothetical protein
MVSERLLFLIFDNESTHGVGGFCIRWNYEMMLIWPLDLVHTAILYYVVSKFILL